MTSRHMPRRLGAAGLTTIAAATLLSGCVPSFLPGGSSGAVGFDDVQQATLQIESVGTFVSPEEGGYEAAGRGSGFLISENGLAVTNNHVVVGAGTLKVWRAGDTGTELNAKVLGSSECLDLAVIQLEKDSYPHFDWRSDDITTAIDVYAAGFPLGDPTFTMTRGIVSKADTPMDTPWASLDDVIEHDARIRGGNSGGPLVDAQGRVVGVNYAGNDQYDQSLAIHRDQAQEVIAQLAKGENVLSLGINGTALTDEEGTGLGVWVNSVASGSSADKAGVKPGDLLTKLEGVSVGADGTMSDYCNVLRTHGQDATLSAEVFRPADGLYYSGQFNGDPIEADSVVAAATGGTASSGGSAAASADFVSIVDDSGSVTVDVPVDWSDVDTAAFTDPRGGTWASIEASPDRATYGSGWSAPGISVLAAPTATATISSEEWLQMVGSYVQQDGCVLASSDAYSDGAYEGTYDYYTDCGGVGASFLMLAATSVDGTHSVALSVQALTDADLAALDRALGSFIAAF
ncbi:S1C family serine protease [Amnibacterium flavum]|uniref:PDZ domain-containing protein n=1 Tax=Amnibacterium flavum TaxID=2173173 RepID=A0A2V1HZ60_9MICO|nr:trypsin-like peptidase domain-containing protein [Amnibacterium flavum]PVZ96257.1 hypothetical protein DDQ50_07550 [Amnibacterium flavum]